MRIEAGEPAPAREAAAPGSAELRGLLDGLARQDWLADCLALQSEMRTLEHAHQRLAIRQKLQALHVAERELRAALEEEQRYRDAQRVSNDIGTANGVIAGLVGPVCWIGALIHGLACAAHIGQATYCADRAEAASREAFRLQGEKADLGRRKLGLLEDMQRPLDLERRMVARLLQFAEEEHRARRSALGAQGGGHAGGARW